MTYFLILIVSFLLGSIPTAYIFAKHLKNVDIREHGSGNVGATNAVRVLGKPIGIAVFISDFLKGSAAVLLTHFLLPAQPVWSLWVGVAAIFGHIFTPFLGFKGGKGVATGAGVLAVFNSVLFVGIVLIWGLSFLATKIVSLSSLVAMGSLVVLSFFVKDDGRVTVTYLLALLLMIWTHRSNLSRIAKGEEKAIGKPTKK